MKLKAIIHEAEEGGYWAEAPSIPGCATQGESMVELINNLHDAVEVCLTIDMDKIHLESRDTVMELTRMAGGGSKEQRLCQVHGGL